MGTRRVGHTGTAGPCGVVVFRKPCSVAFDGAWLWGSNPGSPSHSCGGTSTVFSFMFPT